MGYKGSQLKKTQGTKYSHEKIFPQKTKPKMVSVIVHRKESKDSMEQKKTFFHRKSFSQKPMPMIASMGCAGKLLKNSKRKFHQNSIPQKVVPKIVSRVVHKKGIKKRNPKLKKLFSLEYHFLKNLSQRSYQWSRQRKNFKK